MNEQYVYMCIFLNLMLIINNYILFFKELYCIALMSIMDQEQSTQVNLQK